ncbi:hypothetical protein XH98_38940 [Bradyrhizobium sp. CCBAU 51745]|uniref:hypothetical protein n=1 Tax=Bradyrhizobium sp. CCBAU 51745 TaxID=1325099 RepID=UPI002305FA5D|nr:hypothetical protein [Bradyrhizobium sp. CCBAU 51745]MDA9405611.1 hypothetical protein [Bradyrhizobium sp. CCBAU 45384]MDA9444932.1 hypothetical protein [Bradyrhizobium sp. CCBAU 51745]
MRKRSEPHTFEQRLHEQRLRLENELSRLPDGGQRDALAARIDQLKTAAEMYDFLKLGEAAAAAR